MPSKSATPSTCEEIKVGGMAVRFPFEGAQPAGSVTAFEFDVSAGAKVGAALVTIRSTTPPDDADRRATAAMLDESGSHRPSRGAKPEHYPAIGAVALDAMAVIAGPAWAPDHERAWTAAFDLVVGAMLAGARDKTSAAVA